MQVSLTVRENDQEALLAQVEKLDCKVVRTEGNTFLIEGEPGNVRRCVRLTGVMRSEAVDEESVTAPQALPEGSTSADTQSSAAPDASVPDAKPEGDTASDAKPDTGAE